MKFTRTDKVVIGFAILALIFSFTARFDFPYTRLFGGIWNLGHIIAFYIWTYLCLRFITPLKNLPLFTQFLLILISTIAFGIFMEYVQQYIGRSAEITDLISDICGSSLAFLFHSNRKAEINAIIRDVITLVIIGVMLILHRGIILMPINDYYTYKTYPVIVNPGSPFEISKFFTDRTTKVKISKDDEQRKYFDIVFKAENEFSTIMIEFFPKTWEGYNTLQLELHNPQQDSLPLTLRINDAEHRDNLGKYSDRFNHTFELAPGFNFVNIPIADIQNAPVDRQMNLSRIDAVDFFSSYLDEQKHMGLYKIRLLND